MKERYKEGKIGDVEVKKQLVEALERFLKPFRDRRRRYEEDPRIIGAILRRGVEIGKREAKKTIEAARNAMGLNYKRPFGL